jgi:hypothetical protein
MKTQKYDVVFRRNGFNVRAGKDLPYEEALIVARKLNHNRIHTRINRRP